MNRRTAKLLHRVAVQRKVPVRLVKRFWNQTPRNKRGQLRKEFQAEIE
jgi:hypothetical protein